MAIFTSKLLVYQRVNSEWLHQQPKNRRRNAKVVTCQLGKQLSAGDLRLVFLSLRCLFTRKDGMCLFRTWAVGGQGRLCLISLCIAVEG